MTGRLLAIDTATSACSVALFDNGDLIASDYQEIGRGHAERLIPMIAALPDNGRAKRIIVNCGPGSFTGVRIGLSAAKALALAWNSEVSAYQCLHLVAAQALDKMTQKSSLYVTMNGGHGEYFVQNFTADGIAQDDLQSLGMDAAQKNAQSPFFAGSAAQILAAENTQIIITPMLPDASKTQLLGDNANELEVSPIYGRAPDATPANRPDDRAT